MASKDDVIKEFQKIKGVGAKKAKDLYDSGFTSIDKLKKASKGDISSVEGFSDNLAVDIKNQLVKSDTKKTEEKKKTTKESKKEVKGTKTKEEKTKKPEDKKEEIIVEEETEIDDEEKKYQVKKKPELTDDLKKLLTLRRNIKKDTPEFNRQEWHRYKRLKKGWRKPRGLHSKMRKNLAYRPDMARVGFRVPKKVRGLHPSGFEEVMVYNVQDIEQINPKTQAARVGGSVGTKKRIKIIKKAEELDIRILNK